MNRVTKSLLLITVLAAVGVMRELALLDVSTSCAGHAPSGIALTQDRPKEEEPEGNPNHRDDNDACATMPKDGKGMIACSCHKWRKCDTGVEPKSCRNYCFKHKCKCATPCV